MLLVLMGLVAASHLPCPALEAVTYTSGVASGDVTETGVILWTQVDQVGQVTAQVALDSGFQQLLQSVPVMAGPETDFTVKIEVDDLQPETRYFYRFVEGAQYSSSGLSAQMSGCQGRRFSHDLGHGLRGPVEGMRLLIPLPDELFKLRAQVSTTTVNSVHAAIAGVRSRHFQGAPGGAANRRLPCCPQQLSAPPTSHHTAR
jgi:hypothetical protein